MPKRSLDIGKMDMNLQRGPPRKTERSHEENQERAYIAASRRADRSIEARVQSARMASDIHKKRTGKAFRITEEIVMKEEMYEEEDDGFPRSYRLLGPHMQTASPQMNSRVEAYLSNRVAMSAFMSATDDDWRGNAVNRAFAEMFPNAQQQAESMSQTWQQPPAPPPPRHARMEKRLQSVPDLNFNTTYQPTDYDQSNNHIGRVHSFSGPSSSESSHNSYMSPPALTPGTQSGTPHSQASPYFASMPADFGTEGSAFTAELPAEAKMLMQGMNVPDELSHLTEWSPDSLYNLYDNGKDGKLNAQNTDPAFFSKHIDVHQQWDPSCELNDQDVLTPMNGGEEPSWDSFINANAWTNEQDACP
ncbi:hypothetical protein G7046_g5853 [Stylonectria norvegica]|nr:hypothetical protein G7046_g5853 [Stylonectria norvegica]